jgi:hypothetical protein
MSWSDEPGTNPHEPAAAGLEWRLSEPVSTARIATVRLRVKDSLVSDELAEVHVTGGSVEAGGYRAPTPKERSV